MTSPSRPSALDSPSAFSAGYCCRKCLAEDRIVWYKNQTCHRIVRRHWPQKAERRTDDERLYSDVMGKETIQHIIAQAKFQRRVDRILAFWKEE